MSTTNITAPERDNHNVGSLVFVTAPVQHVPAARLAELLAAHDLADAVAVPPTITPEEAIRHAGFIEGPRVAAELERMTAASHAALDLLPSHALKKVVTDIMIAAGAVMPTRRPGVFFLPPSGRRVVDAVRSILAELVEPGDKPLVAVTPVRDTDRDLMAMIAHARGEIAATPGRPYDDAARIDAAQPIVGYVVLRDLPDLAVPRATMAHTLSELGLRANLAKLPTSSFSEAFYLGCAPTVRARYALDHHPHVRVRLTIKTAVIGTSVEGRQLVRVASDGAARTLTTLATITLAPDPASPDDDRDAPLVLAIERDEDAFDGLTASERANVEDQLTRLNFAYQAALQTLSPWTFPYIIDKVLQQAYVIDLTHEADRSFVAVRQQSVAEAAQQLVRSLTAGRPDCHLVLVPVTAGSELADYVQRTATATLSHSVAALSKAVANGDLRRAKSIDPTSFLAWESRALQLHGQGDTNFEVLPADVAKQLADELMRMEGVIIGRDPLPGTDASQTRG